MLVCEQCNCIVPRLYTMPNKQRLCDYCSVAALTPEKKKTTPRKVNNTQFSIKQKYGSIKQFCSELNLSYALVKSILQKAKAYQGKPTKGQIVVLRSMIHNHVGEFLVGEDYLSEDLYWELKVTK